jgi:cytochrome c biogenesis protein CcmG/thiol:disulfide interchange protein DsbE
VTAAPDTVPDGGPDAAPARRRRWPAAVALVVLVALVGALLAGRLGDSAPAPSALVGQAAPPLQGQTLDGAPFDLTEWRGQVVLVNLWASWCAPCRREHPLLTSAQAQLGPRGLRVVGVDVRDGPEQARAFLGEHAGAATWPSVLDPDGTRAVEWGTSALPETYLVDRDGTVVAKAIGEVDPAWITGTVVPLLDGQP